MQRSAGAPISFPFLVLTALFVTCLIVSNITAVKLVSLGGLVVTAAIIIFPVSYILGDVLTEVYGYDRARRVIWLGFLCNLVAVAAIWIGGLLPAAGVWNDQPAYDAILGAAPRLILASFVAYLFGEFTNAYILAKLKLVTAGRYLWVRTIGSTLVGQFLDSAIFATIAFAGLIPLDILVLTAVSQWLAKSAYEVLATPVTYWVVGTLKRIEGIDVYDRDTRFNPFAWSASRTP